jgi:hypothetical protein
MEYLTLEIYEKLMAEDKEWTKIGVICRNCNWGHDALLHWIGSDRTYSCMQCKTVLLDSNISIEELFGGLGWEGDSNVRDILYELKEVE